MSEDEMKKCFASNIEYFIRLSGRQQRDVAAALGVAPTTFNTWCVGKILPTLPKLQMIAEYFGIQVDDLIQPLVGRKPPFAERLSLAMEYAGISQRELERLSGIPQSAIQRYASGTTDKVPLDRIETLARALNVSAKYLVGWSDVMREPDLKPSALTSEENEILLAYRTADDGIKDAVAKLLDVDRGKDGAESLNESAG